MLDLRPRIDRLPEAEQAVAWHARRVLAYAAQTHEAAAICRGLGSDEAAELWLRELLLFAADAYRVVALARAVPGGPDLGGFQMAATVAWRELADADEIARRRAS